MTRNRWALVLAIASLVLATVLWNYGPAWSMAIPGIMSGVAVCMLRGK